MYRLQLLKCEYLFYDIKLQIVYFALLVRYRKNQ